jgi:hypothetical protein
MKSQLFKTAWQLVKEMQINFSLALKIAWGEFKIQTAADLYNATGCNDWHLGKKITAMENALHNIKPCPIRVKQASNVIINNDGAAAWYGIGVYNGD